MRRTLFSRLSQCAAALAIAAFAIAPSHAAEDAVIIPPPAMDAASADGLQTAVLAGGCFWGVQGVFQHTGGDRKSTRLNSSHANISYAVFCLKKKKKNK